MLCDAWQDGSVDCIVAAELSTMSCPPRLLKGIALAKLSLAGGGATTVKVGKGVGPAGGERVIPPPGGSVRTPTEFMLPVPVMKLPGIVADNCVGDLNVVGMTTCPCG